MNWFSIIVVDKWLILSITGSTARIGPKMLITSDPDVVRRMNAVRSPFTRGSWYTSLKLHPESENIACYIDEGKHANMRNRMSPGYSGKENLHLEQDVDELVLQMLDLIQSHYVSRSDDGLFRTMDLSQITSYFTLDVISKIAFGQSCGFMALNDDLFGYMENLKTFLPAVGLFGVFTELTNILRIPFVFSSFNYTFSHRMCCGSCNRPARGAAAYSPVAESPPYSRTTILTGRRLKNAGA